MTNVLPSQVLPFEERVKQAVPFVWGFGSTPRTATLRQALNWKGAVTEETMENAAQGLGRCRFRAGIGIDMSRARIVTAAFKETEGQPVILQYAHMVEKLAAEGAIVMVTEGAARLFIWIGGTVMGKRMKIFPVIIFTVLTSISSAFAQYWANTYGGEGDEIANSVQKTPDGGYIVAGGTTSFGAGESDAWVMKLDINGTIEWQKTYGGVKNDSGDFIQQTQPDEGYIVAATTTSFSAQERNDIWFLKLTATH